MEWPLPLKFSQNKLAFVSNIPSLPPPAHLRLRYVPA